MVLESQLPHKIVNLLFTITSQNNKLMILWGISLSKSIHEMVLESQLPHKIVNLLFTIIN